MKNIKIICAFMLLVTVAFTSCSKDDNASESGNLTSFTSTDLTAKYPQASRLNHQKHRLKLIL